MHTVKGDERSDDRLDALRATYRATLAVHGISSESVRSSLAGQRDRFSRFVDVLDLTGASVVDVGCGLGDLKLYLDEHVEGVDYLGVDLVPEMVDLARRRLPRVRFAAVDVLTDGLPDQRDHVLMSGVFNDPVREPTAYMQDVVSACWPAARRSLAFNFISDRATHQEPGSLAYHDPATVLTWCLGLTPYVELGHYYARADVSVVLRRNGGVSSPR